MKIQQTFATKIMEYFESIKKKRRNHESQKTKKMTTTIRKGYNLIIHQLSNSNEEDNKHGKYWMKI